MENLKYFRKLTTGLLVSLLCLGLSQGLSLSVHANELVEKDLGSVETSSFEADIIGQTVAVNNEAPAVKAKEEFSSGFKGVGRGFKNGTKATGRGFKKAGHVMGNGFKTAGKTVGRSFKKAGVAIRNFFTGRRSDNIVEEREIRAEGNAAGETQSDLEAIVREH